MDNKLKRAPGVYLAGFMGSGKTTIARVLADRLGWDFIDLDAKSKPRNTPPSRSFSKHGASRSSAVSRPEDLEENDAQDRARHAFGDRSRRRIVRAAPNTHCWKAMGSRSGWIVRSTSIQRRIAEADSRPLARDPERFRHLYEERRAAVRAAPTTASMPTAKWSGQWTRSWSLPCWK